MWLILSVLGLLADAGLPADAVVLPGSTVERMWAQCSRRVPPPGEGTWQPDARDIAALESALPAALASRHPRFEADWAGVPDRWRRQYVGVVRGDRRFIYGNFYPRGVGEERGPSDRWRREPLLVCDGGPTLFGVEFDVEAGTFTHFAFNGVA